MVLSQRQTWRGALASSSGRVYTHRPALAGGGIGAEQPVHRAPVGAIDALVEQGRVHGARGLVNKALAL